MARHSDQGSTASSSKREYVAWKWSVVFVVCLFLNQCLMFEMWTSILFFSYFLPQVSSRQRNALMSDPSIYSLTLCWIKTSRAWPTGAATKAFLTKVSVWTVGRIAATHWATISRRSAVAPARGSTWRHALRCLTNVCGLTVSTKDYIYTSPLFSTQFTDQLSKPSERDARFRKILKHNQLHISYLIK